MAIVNYKCNDGSFETRDTDNNGRQDVPCRRNGGIDPKQYNDKTVIDSKEQEALEKAMQKLVNSTSTQSFLQKNKTTLIFFGALAVSWLIYKKLK